MYDKYSVVFKDSNIFLYETKKDGVKDILCAFNDIPDLLSFARKKGINLVVDDCTIS